MRGLLIILSILVFAPSPGRAADWKLDDLAGVYKYDVPILFADGEQATEENILEIVKVSGTTAYIRAKLWFANAHQCTISGMADVTNNGLIFVRKQPGNECRLQLDVYLGNISFDDEGQKCREATCGARGLYDGISFNRGKRRSIRYMDRLLKSVEYEKAVQDRADGKTGLSSDSNPPRESN